jgi:hypothetical protein
MEKVRDSDREEEEERERSHECWLRQERWGKWVKMEQKAVS